MAANALAGKRLLGPRIIVELTESAAIQNLDETRAFVVRVKDLGCRIAIDDFGAGCTSFRNLRGLGVDLVKIDGGFVRNLASSPEDRAFVRMLIGLAKQLGLETVAEWVQDGRPAPRSLTEWELRLSAGRADRCGDDRTSVGERRAPRARAPRFRQRWHRDVRDMLNFAGCTRPEQSGPFFINIIR